MSGLFIYLVSPPIPKRVDKDIGRVSANPIGCCFFHHIFPNFIEKSYLAELCKSSLNFFKVS